MEPSKSKYRKKNSIHIIPFPVIERQMHYIYTSEMISDFPSCIGQVLDMKDIYTLSDADTRNKTATGLHKFTVK